MKFNLNKNVGNLSCGNNDQNRIKVSWFFFFFFSMQTHKLNWIQENSLGSIRKSQVFSKCYFMTSCTSPTIPSSPITPTSSLPHLWGFYCSVSFTKSLVWPELIIWEVLKTWLGTRSQIFQLLKAQSNSMHAYLELGISEFQKLNVNFKIKRLYLNSYK